MSSINWQCISESKQSKRVEHYSSSCIVVVAVYIQYSGDEHMCSSHVVVEHYRMEIPFSNYFQELKAPS